MSNIGISPASQTLAPSYVPLGKSTTGLESAENKDQTLPPVEEANAGEKNRNQPHQKAKAVSSDHGGGDANHHTHQHQSTEQEPESAEGTIATIEAASSPALLGSAQPQLETALQRAAALHGENAPHGIAASTALDRFNAAAGHTLAPGVLLDQRS